MSRSYVFVAPDAQATMSGGNIYNAGLVSALRAAGADVNVMDRNGQRGDRLCFVDSLYIDDLPRFAPCRLIAHYLPSLVEGRATLTPSEHAALVASDGFVVPSAFMADALMQLAPEPRPIAIVAPGIATDHVALPRTSRAVLVANLVPAKGVLPFLRAVASSNLAIDVIGSLDRDPDYAAACRSAAPSVAFLGELSHAETLARIAASDFLVSASRMESFGLALAEARALGVPILARSGGNAFAHVDEAAGGSLCNSDDALAAECVQLARDRAEMDRRRHAAVAHRPPTRTWADAARDFQAAFND